MNEKPLSCVTNVTKFLNSEENSTSITRNIIAESFLSALTVGRLSTINII